MKRCCNRKECFAYCKRKDNNCAALETVYADGKCPFFKTLDQVDDTTKKLVGKDKE